MHTVLVHIANDEPIMTELENLPDSSSQMIFCMNPRRRDGKEIHYVMSEVQTIIIPLHRVTFIEVMPSGDEEEIVSIFVD